MGICTKEAVYSEKVNPILEPSFLDEVSMVSTEQFLQCDVRLRQAKLKPNARFGNLAMNICGDFLQLPPVDKHGTRKSPALPLDEVGDAEEGVESAEQIADVGDVARRAKHKEQVGLEGRQGFQLWRSIQNVVNLHVNVRAHGVLSRLQAEIRAAEISDDM